jgi:hypothetical protein
MKKNLKIKSPWNGIEELKKKLESFEVGNAYKFQFTSLDRISELQEIFFLIKTYLNECSINDENNLKLLKNELDFFSSLLGEVQREWEDCIAEVELISQKLQVDKASPDETSMQSDMAFGFVVNEQVNTKLVVRKNLNIKEQIEFSKLLSEIAKSRNVKIEDTRGRPSGGLFVSLLAKPGHVESIKLKRLVALGLEIWPGKHYLNM